MIIIGCALAAACTTYEPPTRATFSDDTVTIRVNASAIDDVQSKEWQELAGEYANSEAKRLCPKAKFSSRRFAPIDPTKGTYEYIYVCPSD